MFLFFISICFLIFKDKTDLSVDNFNNMYDLPVIRTIDIQRYLDSFLPWLDNKHRKPFLVVGPDGCGKGLEIILIQQKKLFQLVSIFF